MDMSSKPKGRLGVHKRVVSKRVVLEDVPRHQKPERGYIRMFPGTKNWNEGKFAKTALLRNRPLKAFVSSRKGSIEPSKRFYRTS